ncbi:adenylate/guanylate cyclase domain-containing protein [Tenacibaculum finnmarkense]|uniref:adenylate/guanylate cyclase domain-containing protein n=1 Tax=Tenacibaculum finnmarkense TaxID=2781243 RepID=UPI001EFC28CC|nr:adenylate/guanylate cyclase domain-containing protein [Tenacibaculum finnmarkense]MCG8860078.1 adenylate/guanylate cyclase domain-containing protein [Tenacibaculum finnmarkense]
MKSNYQLYDYEKSKDRIDEILNTSDTSYEEVDEIPNRDKLTFTNGFYVNCSALFVDIRSSSKLPSKYRRPTLARIYRAYISEIVALLNGDENCKEINIHGDSVWGVFNTPKKIDVDRVFRNAYEIASIVDTLNCKLKKKKIDPIEVGIGIDYGRALMIKAGYSGSKINEVVWMGEVVNNASKLCSYGNKTSSDYEIMLSNAIYNNLKKENQDFLYWNSNRSCYNGNVTQVGMNAWINENCK